jgi:hypothetical protein
MSSMLSDHKIHQATCNTSETTRQTDVAAAIALGGAAAVAAIKTAEIAHYRRVVASCLTNGLPFSNFSQALINLGTGGT